MFKLSSLFFGTAAFILASNCIADSNKPVQVNNQNHTGTCDTEPNYTNLTKYGVAKKWQTSDDPVYYLSPGKSYCGANYTDQSNVVCLSPGHFTPISKCDSWVKVTNPKNNVVAYGRVLEECGDVVNSTFGCNDIYLSKQMFEALAGNQKNQAIESGHLDQVQWRYTLAPCWSAYAGLPGNYPNGTQDQDVGLDSDGFLRCGRKTGGDRIVGADVAKVCNNQIKDCAQADKIAKTLPKYHGKDPNYLSKAVAHKKN